MVFAPIHKMMERVKKNSDSDTVLFYELLYAGEFVTKTTALSMIASLEEDRDNHRYQFLHTLVRADGIGEWAATIDKVCTGPAAQYNPDVLSDDYRVFTERVGVNSWQYKAVQRLQEVLEYIVPDSRPIGRKTSLRAWFLKFSELRNKTRGHGAITPATCTKLVPALLNSIELMISGNPMFQKPWAYLHRNLSGRYRVVELGGDTSSFSYLTTAAAMNGENYLSGVYIWVEKPRLVSLLFSDVNATDFFISNGGFDGKSYEAHSPITDDRRREDASPYFAPPSDRPASETEGMGELDIVGKVLTNLPAMPRGYVKRPDLEREVRNKLIDDRHPVVTLVGRGGIGKTSLALTILHEIANLDRYQVIVWFSARDIDLTPTGPKVVQPKTITEKEIAKEYRKLIAGSETNADQDIMLEDMRSGSGGPTLFVFDNFETVRSPIDLYQWIDTNIRSPNKVVITSRFREFKADYPIEISGMEYAEAKELILKNSITLNIANKVGTVETDQIIRESDGHPYVIKIMLGEIADKGTFSKPTQILARKDDILNALFERTYENLSPLANRIFLTLSGWRSLVPQLAIDALLRWRSSESVDPETSEPVNLSPCLRREWCAVGDNNMW